MTALSELARLAQHATPGPWRVYARTNAEEWSVVVDGGPPVAFCDGRRNLVAPANAALIAACDPGTVAALVRAVQAAIDLEAADTALIATELEAGTPVEITTLQGEYAKAMSVLGAALAPFLEEPQK